MEVSLDSLSSSMGRFRVESGLNGMGFVIEGSGIVLAATGDVERARRNACFSTTGDASCAFTLAVAHPDARVSSAAAIVGPPTDHEGVETTHDGANHIGYGAIDVHGFHLVVVIVDETENISPVTQIVITVVFTLIEVLIFIFVFLRMKKVYVQPMAAIVENMKKVTSLNFNEVSLENDMIVTPVREISEVALQFMDMQAAVQGFARYVPKEVIRELQETGNLHSRIMTSKVLTFMFVDIANFTTMCESLTTDDLVELAEKYFSVATRACTIHGCTVDKFIGDAIMGFWGAPLDYTLQGFSACCTALHLQTIVQRLKPFFETMNQNLSIRIGLHRGSALVGNIGCEERISYTALGPNVTFASKLEGMNKPFGTYNLISEKVLVDAERSHPGLFVTRRLGTVSFKNDENVPVFELVGIRKSEFQKLVNDKSKKKNSRKGRARNRSTTALGDSDGDGDALQPGAVGTGSGSVAATYLDIDSARPTQTHTNTGTGSSGGLGVVTEKFAMLSEIEEITNIRTSFQVPDEGCVAIDMLSRSVVAYEQMQFDEAVNLTRQAMETHKDALTACGVTMPILEKQIKIYEKMQRQKPTKLQFNGGVLKQ